MMHGLVEGARGTRKAKQNLAHRHCGVDRDRHTTCVRETEDRQKWGKVEKSSKCQWPTKAMGITLIIIMAGMAVV